MAAPLMTHADLAADLQEDLPASSDANRTLHASQAFRVSELLELKFAMHTLGSQVVRQLKVVGIDGPSTDGGRKARQSMTLADRKDQVAGLVVGYLDVPRRTAELKSYVVLADEHRKRHHHPLDFSLGDYDRFVKEVTGFLKGQGIDTRLSNLSAVRPARESPRRRPAAVAMPGQTTFSPRTMVFACAASAAVAFAGGLMVGVTLFVQ